MNYVTDLRLRLIASASLRRISQFDPVSHSIILAVQTKGETP